MVKEEPYIRWINGVLGTGYTNWRATQVWTLEKLLHREDWCAKYNRDLLGLVGTIPVECVDLKQIESYMAACRLDEFLQGAELTQERIDALLKEKSLSMETFYALSAHHFGSVSSARRDAGGREESTCNDGRRSAVR